MAYITSSVEYAIHCLLFLVNNEDKPLSSKDLAELQGVSPSFMAKIFLNLKRQDLWLHKKVCAAVIYWLNLLTKSAFRYRECN